MVGRQQSHLDLWLQRIREKQSQANANTTAVEKDPDSVVQMVQR
jgi:hypothetical protein